MLHVKLSKTFILDKEGQHYINCAYMSHLLKSVEQAGIDGVRRKSNPQNISANDFFSDAKIVRSQFAKLVNGQADRIAIIPSASYGLGNVIRNIKPKPGGNVITVV